MASHLSPYYFCKLYFVYPAIQLFVCVCLGMNIWEHLNGCPPENLCGVLTDPHKPIRMVPVHVNSTQPDRTHLPGMCSALCPCRIV